MRANSTRGGSVLVFGENINDSASIKELLLAANSALDPRRVKALPRPHSLTRDAKPDAVGRWVAQLAAAVRGHRATGAVAAVVVHRDADGPDPDGERYRQLADQIGPIDGPAVVPVQTIEAWWFLFPDAVESVRPSAWRGRLSRRPRDVEGIAAPKAELCRLTRTKRAPEYTEADSPMIARHIRQQNLTPLHHCPSYERLRTASAAIR